VKYGFIREQANDYPVNMLCRLLSVQRSSYYDWRGRPGKVIPPEELALRRRMRALFAASRDSLGSRTMAKNLRQEGFEIGRDKTRRLMKQLQLKVKQKRKYKVTTDSKHNFPVAKNVLNREFSPSAPNQAWGTDITYLWTQQGWIYLAVVIDLYSRRVVGWSIDRRMKKALVIRALMMAVNLRKPPPGLIHHSDRGSQYASHDYQKLLRQYGLICSMSRKGNCWDNAPVERFFSSLKREWTGDRLYRTRQEAIADVREYVAVYYNSKRLHSTLGYTTPMNYEKDLNKVSGIS
jgi:transposase InsO family protein